MESRSWWDLLDIDDKISTLDIPDKDSEDEESRPALAELGLMGEIEFIDDKGEHLTFLGGGDCD